MGIYKPLNLYRGLYKPCKPVYTKHINLVNLFRGLYKPCRPV